MLSEGKKVRCKKSLEHDCFLATAHVVEEWVVDDRADFLEINSSIETTHAPDEDSVYTCKACGSDCEVVDTKDWPYECENCGVRYKDREELGEIQDIFQRVEEGEPMPSGECHRCHALVHRRKVNAGCAEAR